MMREKVLGLQVGSWEDGLKKSLPYKSVLGRDGE